MSKKRRNKKSILYVVIILLISIISYIYTETENKENYFNNTNSTQVETINLDNLKNIPEYKESPYVTINNNIPNFDEKDCTTKSFEKYSDLDNLGRCGVAYTNLSRETMPPEGDERGDINSVTPTGWKQKKYDGKYLYNRCHLIGYQLSGEDANKLNLITGTRYFNVSGMLPFENEVAEYLKNQNKNENRHVLYRVTPVFEGNNLVASGVQIEAYSVEDKGKGVCFNVYIYNVQPGVKINYATGQSSLEKN